MFRTTFLRFALSLSTEPWTYVFGAVTLLVGVAGTVHVILNKRDVRAAIGWVGVIWVAPLFGAIAYAVLGVNRIHRRAVAIFGERPKRPPATDPIGFHLEGGSYGLSGMRRLVDGLVRRPMVRGNRVKPLVNGDQAFAAMLDAIAQARKSIALESYIFDHDPTGHQFAEALVDAQKRGVEVRVLIDAIGGRYSRPAMVGELRRRGIEAFPFLPTLVPWRAPYFNLRNHRKILVVDGRLAFAGGMNIRQAHRVQVESPSRDSIADVHFEIEGPAVAQLLEVFMEDWLFCAREELKGEAWSPKTELAGDVGVRAVADGPDRDLDRIRWTLLGAIACAEKRLKIQTPYFLPIPHLDIALETAALRGVEVDLVLPEVGNLLLVHWASRAMWQPVLEAGCRIWLVPRPFDHSKLMIMDDRWSFVGSSNWDPRSLRLNFELNIECWSAELNQKIDRLIEAKKAKARRLALEDHAGRGYATRLLDGATRLFAPYL